MTDCNLNPSDWVQIILIVSFILTLFLYAVYLSIRLGAQL